jgi:outer membrane protein assembly factor BamB
MSTNKYTQFLYSNRRFNYLKIADKLLFPYSYKAHDFQILPDTIPFSDGDNLYLVSKKHKIISWSLAKEKTDWEYDFSSKGKRKKHTETGIICLKNGSIICFSNSNVFALDKSGTETWRKELKYSFYLWHTLVYDNKITIFAVREDLNNFIIHIDLVSQTIDEIPFKKKIMPDFFMSSERDDSSFIVGYNNGIINAIIEKYNSNTMELLWSKDLKTYIKNNSLENLEQGAYWQGRTLYYNNSVISSIFGGKIIAISAETGELLWEITTADQYSYSFDIKDNSLWLLDGLNIREINPKTGTIENNVELSGELKQNRFHEYNSTFYFNSQEILVGNIFKNQIGLIDFQNDQIKWIEKQKWSFDSHCPILINKTILLYNSVSGKAKILVPI